MYPVPLIEVRQLQSLLGDNNCIPVDCRFDLMKPDAGYASWREGHIPGARYAHLENHLSRPPLPEDGRHPLPEPESFARQLGAWGITADSYVVVYDGGPGAVAARMWWMLRWLGHERVAVLNGGFNAWCRSDQPVESKPPAITSATYVPAGIRHECVASAADVATRDESCALIDVRAAERYRGEQEPIDPVAGHVPGALNLPFTALLDEDGRIKPGPQLRQLLLQVLPEQQWASAVAMCGSGVTACHLLLAMRAAGLSPGRLYAGSWSEWIRDPGRAVVTGH